MLKDKLNEALEAANAEGNQTVADVLVELIAGLEDDGGVATTNSGGGGHGDPDKK